ncbi:MAG: sulfatase, partial [bacterium]
MAGDGVICLNGISQASWTVPSHTSMLTGLYPSFHHINQYPGDKTKYRFSSDSNITLAQILSRNGYLTKAFTGSLCVSAGSFGKGFDSFDESFYMINDTNSGKLWKWLKNHRERKFFLFLHTYEVHAPYTRDIFVNYKRQKPDNKKSLKNVINLINERNFVNQPMTSEMHEESGVNLFRNVLIRTGNYDKETIETFYDGGIKHTDTFIGDLIGKIKELGLERNTLIVFTSDHGDEFEDHSKYSRYNAHAHSLYEELIHVPIIFYLPSKLPKGKQVEIPTQVVDIVPTVLELLGIDRKEYRFNGESLLSNFSADSKQKERIVFSEATSGEEKKSLRGNSFKYIYTISDKERNAKGGERTLVPSKVKSQELYDLFNDPDEKNNLAGTEPRLCNTFKNKINDIMKKALKSIPKNYRYVDEKDQTHKNALKALGYIQ